MTLLESQYSREIIRPSTLEHRVVAECLHHSSGWDSPLGEALLLSSHVLPNRERTRDQLMISSSKSVPPTASLVSDFAFSALLFD